MECYVVLGDIHRSSRFESCLGNKIIKMNHNPQLKDLSTDKTGFKYVLKRRLKCCWYALTAKHFVFIKIDHKNDQIQVDLTNHNNCNETILSVVSYTKKLIEQNENYNKKMNENLEKWLRIED